MGPRLFRSLIAPLLLGACVAGPTQLEAANRIPVAARDRGDRQLVVTIADAAVEARTSAGSSPRPYASQGSYDGSAHAQRLAAHIARDYSLERVAAWHIGSLQVHCVVFEAQSNEVRDGLLMRLHDDLRVESVQPMLRFETRATGTAYNDPLFRLQTGVASMQVPAAHAWARGQRIRVAVIDTGMDLAHPDLAGRVSRAWNLVDDDMKTFRADRHGTAVAGVLAATGDNGIGIVGVAPGAELLALKACWQVEAGQPDECNTLTLAEALDLALKHDARVINLSLAGPDDPLLRRLVEVAIDRGITVVGPQSRESDGTESFPTGVDGVLAVIDANGPPPTAGGKVLAAPGRDVLTLVPGGRYDYVSGVSYSTAMVTGVVALLLERKALTPHAIRGLLEATAGPDEASDGASIVNACDALAGLVGSPSCAGALVAVKPR